MGYTRLQIRACKKLSTMASADCMGIVNTVRRVYDGLVVYQDGRIIPPDVLDTNASLLELVYRTLLIRDTYGQDGANDTEVIELLRQVLIALDSIYTRNQSFPSLNCSLDCGGPLGGRPRFSIEREQLSSLIESGFTVGQVAELIGVSRRTIFRRMSDFNLSVRKTYCDLTDQELDDIVKQVQVEFPACGNKQMMGHLLSRGIRVQQVRVRDSMRRTDLEGVVNRRIGILQRRQYKVPGPRSLFHIDGNHKLIRLEFDRLCQLIMLFSHSGGALLFMAVLMAIAEKLYICVVLIITGLIQY